MSKKGSKKAPIPGAFHCEETAGRFPHSANRKCLALAEPRVWCHPCQTFGHFFDFHLIFGLILRFFCTSGSNFHPRARRTKSRFCSLCVPCVSLPRATQDNSRERNLVAVLVFTSKLNSDTEDSIMEKYIFDQNNSLWYEL